MVDQELLPIDDAIEPPKNIASKQDALPVSTDPMAMIANAVALGADPDNIQKLMDLAERHENNLAKKAFVQAMAQFKKSAPRIVKDVKGHNSKYASLANVVGKVTAALSDCGLSHNWSTKQENNLITVTCTITHEQGYSQSTSLTASPDTSGSKNAIQAIGSTVTYLERYTLLSATGLSAHENDDDGAGSGSPKPEKDWYPEELFAKNFPEWKRKIQSGEKKASQLVSMLRSKYTITDEQIKAINEVSGGDE